eukprot:PhF_6_TR7742/c0_g1_i1/m.11206/K10428/DCTN6; dynactin 6
MSEETASVSNSDAQPKVDVIPKYISDFAYVSRDVVFGHGCVVHPCCKIEAKYGPIIIGEYCVFEEMCEIQNVNDKQTDGTIPPMTIGSNNLFRVGCKIQSKKIGSNNVFDVRSKLLPGSEIADGCVVRATCQVNPYTCVAANTIVYGSLNELTRSPDAKQAQINKKSTYLLSHQYRLLVTTAQQAKATAQQQQQLAPPPPPPPS